MIDGISVALTTWNHLPYLKRCLWSLREYSALPKTEVSIFVDGSDDGTIKWLEEAGIRFRGRFKQQGAFSGWNRAVEACRNEYFIIGEDDTFFGLNWDVKLAAWIAELGPDYIVMPQLVEPTPGSYVVHDCGKTIDKFDEGKFLEFCLDHQFRHEIIPSHQGFWTMKKSLFQSVRGFDEAYDPGTRGTLDLQLRLHYKYPNLRWLRIWDAMVYHFPTAKEARQLYKTEEFLAKHQWNVAYFEEKYGLNAEEAFALIPVGLK